MRRSEHQELVFRALASATRRGILDFLRPRSKTTGEVCDHFQNLDRCTVMQHLGVLEKAELIIVKREGRSRLNYLNPLPIKEIYDRWINEYASNAVELLARMKQEIEK